MRFEIKEGENSLTRIQAYACQKQVIYQNTGNPTIYMIRVSNDYAVLFHMELRTVGIFRLNTRPEPIIEDSWIVTPNDTKISLIQ